MRIGIFAKTFARSSLEAVLQAVISSGLRCMQFNLSCAGLPSLPSAINDAECIAIAGAVRSAGLEMSAVSGTFNLAHPHRAAREDGIMRACQLISKCRLLGTSVITLCSGTRDPHDMWKYHPDNATLEAWGDTAAGLARLCEAAEASDITLAVEPEVTNVISSAGKALEIIEEVGSPRLKVVLDPANLFTQDNIDRMAEVLEEAVSLLGPYIVLVHAKDVDGTNPQVRLPAGSGCLDYGHYLRLLDGIRYDGPLILHGLSEGQVSASVSFLTRQRLAISD